MKLPEPVAWMLDGGVTIEMQFEPYHAGSEWEPLYTREQVKSLLSQADKDFSDGMTVVHLQVTDQMRKRYESVLKQALEAMEGADEIDCDMRDSIDAIRKLLNEKAHAKSD